MAETSLNGTTFISADLLNFYLYGKQNYKGHGPHSHNSVFIPPQLTIRPSTVPGCECGVYSTTWISSGTLFGPVIGSMVPTCNGMSLEDKQHSWELINENGHVIGHVLVDIRSWTAHVVCARHEAEQNLILIQRHSQLFYQATKFIRPGEELLVWYGPDYRLFMGVPEPEQPARTTSNASDVGQPTALSQARFPSKFHCAICRRPFNSRSNLRSHMRIHTLERPFRCSFCERAFSQSSTLRNHVRLHTGEKPYRCRSCHSSYSQLAGLRAHQKSVRHRHPVTPSDDNEREKT